MSALAGLAALVVVGVGSGSSRSETYKLSGKLTVAQEVPKPKGGSGTGQFTGTLTGRKLTWKLTFSGLSGPALQAHIHLGKPGKAGNVLVSLCAPCKSGTKKTITISDTAEKKIEKAGTYVNVHTKKNVGGEIRGQVKSTG